ncbi:MAG TPA: carbon starvation CstA 5TM domain-containing protein [Rhodocyclaceae bacterium]|nr:carbon starvation CstA 5TM domain-containing protein [Rhodocyclaceae bacterium]
MNTGQSMFGISNLILASLALLPGTVVVFEMKKERYAC